MGKLESLESRCSSLSHAVGTTASQVLSVWERRMVVK